MEAEQSYGWVDKDGDTGLIIEPDGGGADVVAQLEIQDAEGTELAVYVTEEQARRIIVHLQARLAETA